MPRQIEVPGHGMVEFPDDMSDEQVVQAIETDLAPPAQDPYKAFFDTPRGREVGENLAQSASIANTGSYEAGMRHRAEIMPKGFVIEGPGETFARNVQESTPSLEGVTKAQPAMRALGALPGMAPLTLLGNMPPAQATEASQGVWESVGGMANPDNLAWMIGPGAAGRVLLPAFAATSLPPMAEQVVGGVGKIARGEEGGLKDVVAGGIGTAAMAAPLVGPAKTLARDIATPAAPTPPPAKIKLPGLGENIPAWLDPQKLEQARTRDYPYPFGEPRGPLTVNYPQGEFAQPLSQQSLQLPPQPVPVSQGGIFLGQDIVLPRGPQAAGQAPNAPVDIAMTLGRTEQPPMPLTPEQIAQMNRPVDPNAPYPFNEPVGPATLNYPPGSFRRQPSGLSMAQPVTPYVRQEVVNPLTIDPQTSFPREPLARTQAADAPMDVQTPLGKETQHPYKPITENQLKISQEALRRELAPGSKWQDNTSLWQQEPVPFSPSSTTPPQTAKAPTTGKPVQSNEPSLVGEQPAPVGRVADTDLQVSVQSPMKMGNGKEVPGYVQVDSMVGGKNQWSSNPTKLKEQGYDIPTQQELLTLPQGKYTLEQAKQMLGKGKEPAQPLTLEQRLQNLKMDVGDGSNLYAAGNLKTVTKQAWNDAIDLAIVGVKAGKKVKEVIEDVVTSLRAKGEKFDEATVRSELNAVLQDRMIEQGGLKMQGQAQAPGKTGATPPPIPVTPPPIPRGSQPGIAGALPDLPERSQANTAAMERFGMERVPLLGRAFGGRSRVKTAQDASVSAWAHEEYGVAPAVAGSFGTEVQGKLDNVFGTSKTGDIRVVPTKEGQSLKLGDVMEALMKDPNAYQLTPSQRKAFDEIIKPTRQRVAKLLQEHDLFNALDEDGMALSHFPRKVLSRPNEGKPTSGAPLGKQSFQKGRIYESEAQGWAKGVKYETSMEKVLTSHVEQVYKAIARKRLMDDPVLGAKPYARFKADMEALYAPEVAAGRMTQTQVDNIVKSVASQGTVHNNAFFGKVFDKETAAILNREFTSQGGGWRKNVALANAALKKIGTGFDVGAPLIQGLVVMNDNPRIWGKSYGNALVAMADKGRFSKYAEAPENRQAIRELADTGSAVGRIDDIIGGLAGKDPFEKVPGLNKVSGVFNRQMQVFMDVAKIEYWKALRHTRPKAEWQQLAKEIESLVFTSRMESHMVGGNRGLAERSFFYAPAYYRAATHLIAETGRALKDGRITSSHLPKAMASFITGSMAMFMVRAYLGGLDKEETLERMNPANVNFMLAPVKDGDKVANIGNGGIFRSFLRLAGKIVAKAGEGKIEDLAAGSSEKNPLVGWLRGHAGPLPSDMWTFLSGEDFLGRPSKATVPEIVKDRATPMWANQEGGLVSKAASFAGQSVMPDRGVPRDPANLAQMGVPERFQEGQRQASVRPRKSAEQAMLAQQRAAEFSYERTQKLEQALPKDVREWLTRNGLVLSPYEASIEKKGVKLPLTSKEREKLDALHVKWYRVFLENQMKRSDMRALEGNKEMLQRVVAKAMANAREAARNEMLMGLGKGEE